MSVDLFREAGSPMTSPWPHSIDIGKSGYYRIPRYWLIIRINWAKRVPTAPKPRLAVVSCINILPSTNVRCDWWLATR